MITELIDVDNAFRALLENQITISGQVVPVRFFNPDPKLKPTPVYPAIVIQPFAPVPSLRQVWTHRVTIPNDPNVTIYVPPELKLFRYQVSGFADNFLVYRTLMHEVEKRFPRHMNHLYITVDGESFDMFHSGITEIPGIDDGTFQFVITCDVYVPVQMLAPETVLAIENVSIDVRADGIFQIIFSDSFDRPNSQEVGNGWVDIGGTLTSEILNNRVRLSNASAGTGILRVIKTSGAYGKRYRLIVDVEVVNGPYAYLFIGKMNGDVVSPHVSKLVTTGHHELEFVSVNDSLGIVLGVSNTPTGERYFDNVIVKELDTSVL